MTDEHLYKFLHPSHPIVIRLKNTERELIHQIALNEELSKLVEDRRKRINLLCITLGIVSLWLLFTSILHLVG